MGDRWLGLRSIERRLRISSRWHKKSPFGGDATEGAVLLKRGGALQFRYVRGFRSFRAVLDFKFNLGVFLDRFEAVLFEGTEMQEHVFTAVISGNKAVAFVLVEPLYFTGYSIHLCSPEKFFIC
jgi:hypothetical protein